MSGGMPFGIPFGFGPMPTPGPVGDDPAPMQLDDELRARLRQVLVGQQMFHPGSMGTAADQGQDQSQDQGPDQNGFRAMPIPNARPDDATAFVRQAPYDPSSPPPLLRTGSPDVPDATVSPYQPATPPTGAPTPVNLVGYGVPAQGSPRLPDEPVLASMLRGVPSMNAGQMPPPAMPAPQQDDPQQGASQPGGPQQDAQPQAPQGLLSGIPSMIGAAFPQMPQPGGPQTTGAIPQQAQRPQAPAPGNDDEEAGPAPATAAPNPATRAVPLPPPRPPDGSILGGAGITPVNSFDPLTGQPVSGSPQPARGDFDPLTGQPISGTLRPVGTPSSGSGTPTRQGADPAPGSAEWAREHPALAAWGRLGDSGIGDQLLAFGAGMLQGRTFGEGAGKAIQNMLAVKQAAGAGDMQRLEYALKLQKAQQEQSTLTGNANFVKSIFAKNGQQISDQQALTLGSNPTVMNDMLKGILPSTEQYTQFEDKDGNRWSRNTRTGQETIALKKDEDKTQTPLLTPQDRAAAGIPADDTRPAWIDPNKKVTFNAQEQTADIRNWQEAKRQGYTGSLVDYQNERARAGANATTINMPPAEKAEQSAIGTARAGVIKEHIEAGRAARDKIQILDQMRGALDAAGPNMMTGPLGEPVLRAKQALGGMLGTQLPGTSATEMFANSGPVLAGAAARAITSRPAQIEFTTMLNAKPGLMNSPEGNRASMDVMRQSAVRDADLSDIAARSSSVDEFIRKRDEYEHAHPMINPFTGKPFGSATPAGPGPLNTQGATAPSLTDLQAEARRRGLIR